VSVGCRFLAAVTVPNRICCVAAGDVPLIYCRVKLTVQFAREPKQLTILSFCRPPRGFIVCCLAASRLLSTAPESKGPEHHYTISRRMPLQRTCREVSEAQEGVGLVLSGALCIRTFPLPVHCSCGRFTPCNPHDVVQPIMS
jgi:hypothetical protein